MSKPTLSVTMANYNHAKYLDDALEAILNQSYRPMEIIVIDDGSTDNSVDVIERFRSKHPIIRLLRNEQNMGAMYNWGRLLELASGDYIYSAGADDRVLPGLFEKSMSLLAQYPKAGLCCSDPATFDARTGLINERRLHWSDKPRYFSPEELAEVIQGWYIAGHTSIIKRSMLLEAGGFIPELKWHCDWFVNLVIGFRHGICYIPEPLAAFRVSDDSYGKSGPQDWLLQSEVLNHLLRLLQSPDYRDALPYFVRGSVMSHFGQQIVRVVMSNPEHWDFKSLMLIQNPLWQWNVQLSQLQQEKAQRFQQEDLENKVRAIFERGNAAIAQGRLDEAHSIFMDLTEKLPNLVNGHVALAKVAAARDELQVALSALKKALKLTPNDPELHNQLGTVCYRIDDHEMAKRSFQQALTLDPANLNACINLAEMAEAQKSYNEAASYYNQALKEHPDNVELLVAAGRLALEIGEPEGAQTAFQLALALDPSCRDARQALGTL